MLLFCNAHTKIEILAIESFSWRPVAMIREKAQQMNWHYLSIYNFESTINKPSARCFALPG